MTRDLKWYMSACYSDLDHIAAYFGDQELAEIIRLQFARIADLEQQLSDAIETARGGRRNESGRNYE